MFLSVFQSDVGNEAFDQMNDDLLGLFGSDTGAGDQLCQDGFVDSPAVFFIGIASSLFGFCGSILIGNAGALGFGLTFRGGLGFFDFTLCASLGILGLLFSGFNARLCFIRGLLAGLLRNASCFDLAVILSLFLSLYALGFFLDGVFSGELFGIEAFTFGGSGAKQFQLFGIGFLLFSRGQ